MYTLIFLKNSSISIIYFETQAEAFSFVKDNQVSKYKIDPPNKKRKLDFFTAWEWSNSANDFVVNIEIAKEIKKNIFREMRSILFQKLDTAFLKAIEQEDLQRKAYIVSLKEKFRDITTLDLPNTEEELINYMPSVLREVYDLVI